MKILTKVMIVVPEHGIEALQGINGRKEVVHGMKVALAREPKTSVK